MLSNRVAAKRAYHRRVEKMESLQKENSFLTQILSERQQRKQHLEALVSRSPFVARRVGLFLLARSWPKMGIPALL